MASSERIIALEQIIHGKSVAQDMRADAFAGDPRPFAEPLEEHLHAIFDQRLARFGEEEMIFSSAPPTRPVQPHPGDVSPANRKGCAGTYQRA